MHIRLFADLIWTAAKYTVLIIERLKTKNLFFFEQTNLFFSKNFYSSTKFYFKAQLMLLISTYFVAACMHAVRELVRLLLVKLCNIEVCTKF